MTSLLTILSPYFVRFSTVVVFRLYSIRLHTTHNQNLTFCYKHIYYKKEEDEDDDIISKNTWRAFIP